MKLEADGLGALLASVGIVTALTIAIVALSAALARTASGEVLDLSHAPAAAIESTDIAEALAGDRGTVLEPAARPGVMLPALFEPGTARFRPGAKEMLEQIAAALASSDLAGFRFAIEWYEPDGADAVLAMQRAAVVQAVLSARGVPEDRLLAVGHLRDQQALVANAMGYVELVRLGRAD